MRTKYPPAARPFVLPYTVGAHDIDAQGRANNVEILRWMNLAAVAHSLAVGLDAARYVALGGMFVVRRHEVDYRAPAFHGDKLELRTWPTLMRAATAHRAHEIVRLADGQMIASGMNVWGFVQPESGRPVRMPQELLDAFDPSRYGAAP